MSDEQRPDRGSGAEPSTPWWAGPPRDPWSARPPAADDPWGTSAGPAAHDPWNPPTGGAPIGTATDAPTVPGVPSPYDPWAAGDTLGTAPRPPGATRPGLLAALAVAIALVAGLAGGAAGYLLADGGGSQSVTVRGPSPNPTTARSAQRGHDTIPGVAARVLPSVVQIRVETSQGQATGSGFVIDESGVIVTNNHVVSDVQGDVEMSFSDGTTATAEVVGTSPSYDLAVLRLKGDDLPALTLGNSDSVVVGDPVLAVGSPLGLSGTVTSGIISAKDRAVTAGGGDTGSGGDSAYINAIQTDAAINPGNSGGPLVNLDGEVIGVNSAIATLNSGLGEGGNIGVGFAIPINQVRRTVNQLLESGKAEFPIIGASLDGRYDGEGARIAEQALDGQPPLVPGGPAEQAGLEPGDVILAINHKPVEGSAELIVAIRSHRPGQTVTLTVRRNGSEQDVDVTLGAHTG